MMWKDKRSRSCWKCKRSRSGRPKQVSMSLKTRSQMGCGNEEVGDLVLKELLRGQLRQTSAPQLKQMP